MGKQKQQVISRFFAPKPKPSSSSSSPPPPSSSSAPNPTHQHPNTSTPPPKITATATFSPSKRHRNSQLTPPPKKPKLSPHTQSPIPSLHQKFLEKLLEPLTPTPLLTPSNPNYTPLEQQVLDLKTKYPDVLLMIEVGYKYRFFGEDAEVAARVLGIYAHTDHNLLTASIPTFRLNVHVRRLVSVGYKVGVVKQTETAAIKSHGSNRLGPFTRGLSALYTKATLEAAEDISGNGEEGCGGCSNYLICVVEKGVVEDKVKESGFGVRIGFVAVEISTGDVVYGEFNDNVTRMALEGVILSLSPAEVLLGDPLTKQTEKLLLSYAGPSSSVRVERASRDCFRDGGALAEVMLLYESTGCRSSTDSEVHDTELRVQDKHVWGVEEIMSMPGLAVQALALIIRHLKQFGFEKILCIGTSLRPFSSNIEMTLSANALQQLEVLRNNSDGSETGSLLHAMNRTLTIFGARLLKHWVAHPLCDRNSISARLDAVSEIAESMGPSTMPDVVGLDDEEGCLVIRKPMIGDVLSSVLTTLGRSPDIQRGITRIFHRTATPSELISVIQAILYAGKQLQQLQVGSEYNDERQEKAVRSDLLRSLVLTASSPTVVSHAAKLLSILNKDAADQRDFENLFVASDDQFPEVAGARKNVQVVKHKLDSLIGLYRKQLGVRNLDFLSVSGSTHLIELPSDIKVPLNWVKVNSTKKTIRYHPPEVLESLDKLLLAKEELGLACRSAWGNFLEGFSNYYAEFQACVQSLAALDCLHSLATISINKDYVRPVFVDDSEAVQIHILSGRHPVLDLILQESFVPNDTNLHANGEYCQIVTGPNMGGKSCYIRQVALLTIMAQVGSFVPASSAKLHVMDGIYTRMGASDSIQQGKSTFLDELAEASQILHNSTSRSLVIIDELGRGTSTHDGVAIAYATLHHLLLKKCMTLFVTHYPKIADIKNEFLRSVGSYHVSYLTSENVRENSNPNIENSENVECSGVTFLYKLVPGTSDKSFGLNVARLAQVPPVCIARAAVMAMKLEELVTRRIATQEVKQLLLESPICEGNVQQNLLEYPGSSVGEQLSSGIGGLEGSGELSTAFHQVFINLKYALRNLDSMKSSHSFKHAWDVAAEYLKRAKVNLKPERHVQDG